MGEKTIFEKLDWEDLYVLVGSLEGEEVKERIDGLYSQIFNVGPELIMTSGNVDVIRVYRRRSREVAVEHMYALVPPKGMPVVVSTSTLYQKITDGTARLLDNFKDPAKTEILTGDEEVIDFGDAFKVKVVVKVELDLKREYGNER
jgi:hypothetical protein